MVHKLLNRKSVNAATALDIRAVNVLKGFAILAVIALHVFSSLPGFYVGRFTALGNITLDQFLRFCVPLFIGLSGYALSKRYGGDLSLRQYLKNRVVRLLPLYLLWSLIFMYVMPFLFPSFGNPSFGQSVLTVLLLGKADYHLYFVPLIVQLYLIFPVLLPAMKKRPRITLGVLALIQGVALFLLTPFVLGRFIALDSIQDQNHYDISLFWIFYFGLGMFLAYLPEWKSKTKTLLPFVGLTLLGFVAADSNAVALIRAGLDTTVAQRFSRYSVSLYASGFLGWSLLVKQRLLSRLGVFSRVLEKLGDESFLIFLSHTFALRIVMNFLMHGMSLVSLVLGLGIYAVLIGVSLLVQ